MAALASPCAGPRGRPRKLTQPLPEPTCLQVASLLCPDLELPLLLPSATRCPGLKTPHLPEACSPPPSTPHRPASPAWAPRLWHCRTALPAVSHWLSPHILLPLGVVLPLPPSIRAPLQRGPGHTSLRASPASAGSHGSHCLWVVCMLLPSPQFSCLPPAGHLATVPPVQPLEKRNATLSAGLPWPPCLKVQSHPAPPTHSLRCSSVIHHLLMFSGT